MTPVRLCLMAATCCIGLATASSAAADPPLRSIEGPAVLCFMASRFELKAGERVTDLNLGVHTGRVEVDGPYGRYSISESDNFAPPRWGAFNQVKATPDQTVHRWRRLGKVEYGVVERRPGSRTSRVRVWLSGAALSGRGGDAQIYERVGIGDVSGQPCDRQFVYGSSIFD